MGLSDRLHIFGVEPGRLRAVVQSWGWPAYRADQILKWVFERGVVDPAVMSDLGQRERAALGAGVLFESGAVIAEQAGSDGTRKLLVSWAGEDDSEVKSRDVGLDVVEHPTVHSIPVRRDSSWASEDNKAKHPHPDPPPQSRRREEQRRRETECVMIPTESRRTACVSSQAGCPVGCTFCASGIGGLAGNLTAGQIVEQVHHLNARLRDAGERISHVVFMGMGEPLANYNAVMDAVRTLTAPWGFHIGARRITISTVGLPSAIERLAHEEIPVTLAISLHAPNDELRKQLIPWAQYTTIAELMAAGLVYFERTGREITLEYILLGGVNDRSDHAQELAGVAKQLRANVNLIRYNEVTGLPYCRPMGEDVRAFQRVLRERGVNVHIRASRGRDIAAACGQLRHERMGAGRSSGE